MRSLYSWPLNNVGAYNLQAGLGIHGLWFPLSVDSATQGPGGTVVFTVEKYPQMSGPTEFSPHCSGVHCIILINITRVINLETHFMVSWEAWRALALCLWRHLGSLRREVFSWYIHYIVCIFYSGYGTCWYFVAGNYWPTLLILGKSHATSFCVFFSLNTEKLNQNLFICIWEIIK